MIRIVLEGNRYDQEASKMLVKAGLFDEETSLRLMRNAMKYITAFHGSGHNWLEKYLKGIARIMIEESDGDSEYAKQLLTYSYNLFDTYLTWILENRTEENKAKLDNQFIKEMSLQEIKDAVEQIEKESSDKDNSELSNLQFDSHNSSDYTLYKFNSYDDLYKMFGGDKTGEGVVYDGVTRHGYEWCHTNQRHYYDHYTSGGYNIYVLAKDGWEDIKFDKESSEKNPYNDYGNSLIAVVANDKGKIKSIVIRSNHFNMKRPIDASYSLAELSDVVGFDVKNAIVNGDYVEIGGNTIKEQYNRNNRLYL